MEPVAIGHQPSQEWIHLADEPFEVPVVRGWHIFNEALRRGSGLAKRARFVISHETGKIEVIAIDKTRIYARYHRAKDRKDRGRFMIYERNDEAHWVDQLEPVSGTDTPKFPPSSHLEVCEGPD